MIDEHRLCAVLGDVCILNKQDGTLLHRYTTRGMVRVATDGQVLYMNVSRHPNYEVRAVRIQDGSLLWSYVMQERLADAPILADGIVYIATDSMIHALRSQDGSLLWRHDIVPRALASSAERPRQVTAPTVANGVVYLAPDVNAPLQPYLYALDASTGRLLWQIKLHRSVSHSLIVKENVIYVNFHDICSALDADDGTLFWQQSTGGDFNRSMIVSEQAVYMCMLKHEFDHAVQPPSFRRKHLLQALQRSDGTPLWQYQSEPDGETGNITAPAVAQDRLYIGTTDGYLVALRVSNGEQLWCYKTDGNLLSTPVVSDEVVYVGANDGDVYAVRADNATLLWQTFIGKNVSVAAFSSLSVKDGSREKEDNEEFKRFAEIVQLAREEARHYQHHFVGTEHLLLALTNEKQTALLPIWHGLGVEPDKVRGAIEFIIGRGDRPIRGTIRLTLRARKVLQLATDEDVPEGSSNAVRVLLGLRLEGEGIAAGVLNSFGITVDKIRSLL